MYINIGDESVADDYIREALGWLNNHMGSEHDIYVQYSQIGGSADQRQN